MSRRRGVLQGGWSASPRSRGWKAPPTAESVTLRLSLFLRSEGRLHCGVRFHRAHACVPEGRYESRPALQRR